MATLRRDHRFAKALARAMKRADLTAAALAPKIGVGRTTVYGWLAGAEPSDRNFKSLVALFPELAEFGK